MELTEKDVQRFETKYLPEPNTGCWLWVGTIVDRHKNNHYGRFWLRGEQMAHRVSYEIYKGKITPGMTIDHACVNSLCVNPDHLREISLSENVARSHVTSPRKGNWWRGGGRNYIPVTTCQNGHRYDSKYSDGRRCCSICNNAPRPSRVVTHCKNGHAIDGDNVITAGQGGRRRCKTCNNTRYLAYYHRKKTRQ